ncbi:MAG: formylglycine-generating enzyme family protein [Verrucomicrobia bacterium]|nr:formylglycine-generating enzyme family protein [Verrucomicrobiota bacterium]
MAVAGSVFACLLCACTGYSADLSVHSSEKQLTVDLGGGIIIEAVAVPAGSFMMGSENGREDEKPVHKVTITKSFYMGKYEVTQEQWEAVMGNNPSSYKGGKHPVGNVSWNDCEAFLAKLNEKLDAWKASLPTEAQWEYACRAGTTTKYFWGDDDGRLGEYAWFKSDAGGTTHPIGLKKPNAWGLYDMIGNVWEWCSDWYGNYTAEPQQDPKGSKPGKRYVLRPESIERESFQVPFHAIFGCVLRGGSFERRTIEEKNRLVIEITSSNAKAFAKMDHEYPDYSPDDLTSSARSFGVPGERFRNSGLRLVLSGRGGNSYD